MRLSIITPFAGSTLGLVADYFAAVQGCHEVIIVDNACDAATASALQEACGQLSGTYIRNDTNIGFAAANNQGYAAATGDAVMFLNSDIAAAPGWLGVVQHDVRNGALYGPSLGYQLVYGHWWPYLEGWCLVAMRETWEKLLTPRLNRNKVVDEGPWDARTFSKPYWEDNALCLEAIKEGIRLVQTRWANDRMLVHKGGQTAGALIKHGAAFEANRAAFAARVRPVWEAKMRAEEAHRS